MLLLLLLLLLLLMRLIGRILGLLLERGLRARQVSEGAESSVVASEPSTAYTGSLIRGYWLLLLLLLQWYGDAWTEGLRHDVLQVQHQQHCVRLRIAPEGPYSGGHFWLIEGRDLGSDRRPCPLSLPCRRLSSRSPPAAADTRAPSR